MYPNAGQRNFARDLRNQATNAEQPLWQLLRAQQIRGHKFAAKPRSAHTFVDFVCFSQKLIVELDGPRHAERAAADHDASRTAWLASQGFRVLRFWNHQLDDEIESVVDAIEVTLGAEGTDPGDKLLDTSAPKNPLSPPQTARTDLEEQQSGTAAASSTTPPIGSKQFWSLAQNPQRFTAILPKDFR
jgi:very-short-patch-repair endonuclease